jgi:hypothetical protein
MSNTKNHAGRKWFDFLRIFALMAGLITFGCQMRNQDITRPVEQEVGSMSEVLQVSRELDKPKYAGIESAIYYHHSDYPIRSTESHTRFSDNMLHEYLGNFETMGILVRDKIVNPNRAYEELGFDLEKAWCNYDVQKYVDDSRKADNQSTAAKKSYGAFEELAKYCLQKDHKTCSDMDKEQIIIQ